MPDEYLIYRDLFDDYMDRDFFEETEDSIVEVTISTLDRGSFTIYLEPGEKFKHGHDEPSQVKVRTL